MFDNLRPAVAAINANRTPTAAPTGVPVPATPTTSADAAGWRGNPLASPASERREIAHEIAEYRGAILVWEYGHDSEGWWYPEYSVRIDGFDIGVGHPRGDFAPTQRWFEKTVDRLYRRRDNQNVGSRADRLRAWNIDDDPVLVVPADEFRIYPESWIITGIVATAFVLAIAGLA